MKSKAVMIFLLSLIVYNLNLRPISSGDTLPAALIPFSLLMDGDIFLDEFKHFFDHPPFKYVSYVFSEFKGHIIFAYSIALPILVTPFYIPVTLYLKLTNKKTMEEILRLAQIMEKIISSLIASFLVVVMFIVLNGVSKRIKTATILSIVYAWGTSTWTISSQALWQHGFANLATILSLYFLFLLHRTGKSTKALLVGQFISLSFAVRHSNILFFVTLMIYIYIYYYSEDISGYSWFFLF